jgi:hypothetical protein
MGEGVRRFIGEHVIETTNPMASTKNAVSLEDLKTRTFTKVKVAGEDHNPLGVSRRIYTLHL